MEYKVVIYPAGENSNVVLNFYRKLDVSTRRKIIKVLKYLQIYGLNADIQDLKKIRGYDFWEVRILGKDNIRLFVVEANHTIYVIHIFRKKSLSTPYKELAVASRRLKILQHEFDS